MSGIRGMIIKDLSKFSLLSQDMKEKCLKAGANAVNIAAAMSRRDSARILAENFAASDNGKSVWRVRYEKADASAAGSLGGLESRLTVGARLPPKKTRVRGRAKIKRGRAGAFVARAFVADAQNLMMWRGARGGGSLDAVSGFQKLDNFTPSFEMKPVYTFDKEKRQKLVKPAAEKAGGKLRGIFYGQLKKVGL